MSLEWAALGLVAAGLVCVLVFIAIDIFGKQK